ncbi:MAG: carboxypeptidase regulatory-like domain-containing protein [Acidobacteria bacterium]|nr:carboxypeptidase regulatory-like domain-containing protein [Acidobacteriota bacterium]
MKNIFFLFLLICSLFGSAYSQIRGKVTDPDGDGLPLISVSITAEDQLSTPVKVQTRKDGQFTFPTAENKKYRVELGATPGFYSEQNTYQHVNSTANIMFPLKKGGVISGSVLNEAGQPLSGIEVYAQPLTPPLLNAIPRSFSRETDDQGNYRIFGLPTGKYHIYAKQSDNSFLSPSRFRGQAAYYYPSGSIDGAIELDPMNTEIPGINIQYFPQVGRAIAGQVGMTINYAYVSLYHQQAKVAQTFVFLHRNRFYFPGLLAGEYKIEATGTDNTGREYWASSKVILTDTDNRSAELTLEPTLDLNLEIHHKEEKTCTPQKATTPGRLVLQPVLAGNIKENWEALTAEKFIVFNLRKAPYRLTIESHEGEEYLYLSSKAYPIWPTAEKQEVTLSARGGVIKGTASAPGSYVQLLPTNPTQFIDFQQATITNGDFSFTNIRPGKYRLRLRGGAVEWSMLSNAKKWHEMIAPQPTDKEVEIQPCESKTVELNR